MYSAVSIITMIREGSCGLGSSVGIATELRAGRSGIECLWRRDFPPVQSGPGVHPASCKMGTGSFPGVKCGRGVLPTIHLKTVGTTHCYVGSWLHAVGTAHCS